MGDFFSPKYIFAVGFNALSHVLYIDTIGQKPRKEVSSNFQQYYDDLNTNFYNQYTYIAILQTGLTIDAVFSGYDSATSLTIHHHNYGVA